MRPSRFAPSFSRRVPSLSCCAPSLLAAALLAAGMARAQSPLPPPDAFEHIVHQPATQSTFTLDRSMLVATDGFFNGQDPDGRRIAAGLNSVTVHNYHYTDYASYDQGAFSVLDNNFRNAGYQHLVNANANSSAPSLTDLWLRFQGTNVNSVVVLSRGDRNMSAIVVDCNLRPLDLLHLGGHFGIPKVDSGAIMVPAGPPPPNGSQAGPVQPPPPPPNNAPTPTLKRHSANDPQ